MNNSKIKQYLIFSVLFFVIVCAGFVFMYKTIIFISNQNRENQLKWEIEESRKKELSSLDRVIATSEQEIKKLDSYFLKESDVVEFLDYLESVSNFISVKTEVLSVSTSSELGYLTLDIKSVGSFDSLYKFLNILENAKYEIKITSFELQKEGGDTSNISSWRGSYKINVLTFIPNKR